MIRDILKVWYSPDGAGGAGTGGEAGQAAAAQTGEAAALEQQPQETEPAAADPKERAKAYRDMIRGEYKDLYDADMQRIVTQRLRGAKEAESSLKKLEGSIDLLKSVYGTDDLDALNRAITDDVRFYEDEAMKRGMDAETYKALRQKDEAIERFRREQQEAKEREEQTRMVMQWRQEEKQLQQTFPDFDLEAEMEASGGELFQMLQRGVSLEHAYLALHMDDIVAGSMQQAMQRGSAKTLETIRSRGMRPSENANTNAQTVPRKVDVSKITRDQMREIEKRLMRGENITVSNF
ncbi:MAG: hypothetical protein IKS31_01370 [Clostridia bacterium]|nr:hypothetical protein [Clostridia bacterium]